MGGGGETGEDDIVVSQNDYQRFCYLTKCVLTLFYAVLQPKPTLSSSPRSEERDLYGME